MFGRSQIVHFAAFLALLSPALATVYRLDDRSPQTVKDAGGLVSWNPAGTGSVIQHVRKELGDQDPWVSTSTDKKLLRSKDRSTNPRLDTFANYNSFFCRGRHVHHGYLSL